MTKKIKKVSEEKEVESIYDGPISTPRFFSTGSSQLDFTLGGGLCLGRMSQIFGPESSNKTGLCTEVCANFIRKFPNGKIYYADAERAYDIEFGENLGLPVDKVEFIEENTVIGLAQKICSIIRGVKKANKKKGEVKEDVKGTDAEKGIKAIDKSIPKLFIIDSLDAVDLSEESQQNLQESGYAESRRAKEISTIFRKINADVEKSSMCLLVISQIRANIGVMFGPKTTTSGGNAMKFYAAQRTELSTPVQIKGPTIDGIQEAIGVRIKFKNRKCKVGFPYRDGVFSLYYGFGIKDYEDNAEWLSKHGKDLLEEITRKHGYYQPAKKPKNFKEGDPEPLLTKGIMDVKEIVEVIERDDNRKMEQDLREAFLTKRTTITKSFLPTRKKYV